LDEIFPLIVGVVLTDLDRGDPNEISAMNENLLLPVVCPDESKPSVRDPRLDDASQEEVGVGGLAG
jgi:hypothetical protein